MADILIRAFIRQVQYIPRNMHTVFALLCFVVVIHGLIFPYPPGLLHWHCGILTIAPVPAKQPWWIWINTSCEFIMNDCITTTKQRTKKTCAYFLGYITVMSHQHYGVPNHQEVKCLFFKLFRLPTQEALKHSITAILRGIYRWQMDSPHERPKMWQAFPCDMFPRRYHPLIKFH